MSLDKENRLKRPTRLTPPNVIRSLTTAMITVLDSITSSVLSLVEQSNFYLIQPLQFAFIRVTIKEYTCTVN